MAVLSGQDQDGLFITRAALTQGKAAKVKFGGLGVRVLMAVAVWLLPATSGWASLALTGTSISRSFGDDKNTSTLYGNPTDPQQMTYCSWVDTSLVNAKAGFTDAAHNLWNFAWALTADATRTLQDLSVTTYVPWVVNQPTYKDANNVTWGGNITNDEAGGAELVLAFNPTDGDPLKGKTVHWIQAVNSTYRGGGGPDSSIHLDGGATPPSPFYDTYSAAGQTYFADVPGANEAEYEGNPVADVQFQVFLALDSTAVADGITTHNVTIYGGEWWGYQYTASDVPEPSTLLVWSSFAAMGLVMAWRRRKRAA